MKKALFVALALVALVLPAHAATMEITVTVHWDTLDNVDKVSREFMNGFPVGCAFTMTVERMNHTFTTDPEPGGAWTSSNVTMKAVCEALDESSAALQFQGVLGRDFHGGKLELGLRQKYLSFQTTPGIIYNGSTTLELK